jgi:uncharacterized Zn-finger protein
MKICKMCGQEFDPKSNAQKYCKDCRKPTDILNSKINICKRCGQEFKGRNSAQKYCSECAKLGKSLLSGKVFDYTKPQVCAYCGKEFYHNRKKKYCPDNDCMSHAITERAKQRRIENKTEKTCPFCGKIFIPVGTQQYCSPDCAREASNKKQREKRSITGKEIIKSITYICKNCGKEYHPKSKYYDSYCGRPCAFAAQKENSKGSIRNLLKNIKPICKCDVCGKHFIGKNINSKLCSDDCTKEKARIAAYKRSKHEVECGWCGKLFVPEYKTNTYSYCCDEHKELAKKQQKREHRKNSPSAKLHKGGVSKAKRLRVFERDSYVCKLCGDPLKMDEIDRLGNGKVHPLAPTVDHIIPVSIAKKMKWHNSKINHESNLQAAHFMCNLMKSNNIRNSFL